MGNGQQFQALFDPDGSGPNPKEDKTDEAQWSSSDSKVATVDDEEEKGVATCNKSGTTDIKAETPGFADNATLTCVAVESTIVAEFLEVVYKNPILFPESGDMLEPGTSSQLYPAITLKNIKDFDINVTLAVSGTGFELITPSSILLGSGQEDFVRIRFTAPSTAGRYDGTVSISVAKEQKSLASRLVDLRAFVKSAARTGTGAEGEGDGGKPAGSAVPGGKATGIFGEGGVADRAVNVAFTALLIAASLFVLLAAFQFVTGADNPEMISQAKDKLIWAAVGIGVALVAKGAAVILKNILLGPSGEPGPEPCPGTSPSGGGGIENPLKTICFSGLLDSILNVIFTLSLIVVPFVVVYAGFLFVTGGGNPAQITRARDTLIWTAVGFGVILISKGLPFILKDILGLGT